MKNLEKIGVGSIIDTEIGCLEVKSFNGHIVYCEEFEVDENGGLESTGEKRLTLSEIAEEMKAVDGMNHTLIFDEEV